MKEKILRATAKVISAEGVESASTRAICEAAEITAPTLYYYFKSKAELLSAVTQFTFDLHRENKRITRTEDAFSNLRLYWDQYIKISISEPELHQAMMIAMSQKGSAKTGLDCFNDLVTEFKSLESAGILKHPALQCAQMYLGAAQGISLVFMALPKSESTPPLSATTRDVMLAGLVNVPLNESSLLQTGCN